MNSKITIEDLRKQLNETQVKILTEMWEKYVETGKGVSKRIIHHKFGKSEGRDAIKLLGGEIIYEARENGKEAYKLTFLGALLTANGVNLEQLLSKYLKYVEKEYKKNPEIETISKKSVKATLGLSENQWEKLCRLISLSPFGFCGFNPEGEASDANVFNKVDDLPEIDDFLEYVQTQAMERYDPNVPTDENRRFAHLSTKGANFHTQYMVGIEKGEFVNLKRLEELYTISSEKFDLRKLTRLCEELNIAWSNECFFSVGILTRAILDHVPPIFSCNKFSEVANNYGGGGKSFKKLMQYLDNSSRKVADAYLHEKIRKKETLPNETQVNYSNNLDMLLGEIIRILSQGFL